MTVDRAAARSDGIVNDVSSMLFRRSKINRRLVSLMHTEARLAHPTNNATLQAIALANISGSYTRQLLVELLKLTPQHRECSWACDLKRIIFLSLLRPCECRNGVDTGSTGNSFLYTSRLRSENLNPLCKFEESRLRGR